MGVYTLIQTQSERFLLLFQALFCIRSDSGFGVGIFLLLTDIHNDTVIQVFHCGVLKDGYV